MSTNPGIHIQDLSYRYKSANNDCLKNVSLNIVPGDKYGIFGPNGAGKTTLISLMTGILSGVRGSIEYKAEDKILSNSEIKNLIGFVPQEYAFYEELTTRQNLEYFGALYNLDKQTISRKTKELLEAFGLMEVIDKKVKTFSGGMKRRVNLAIGVLQEPKILFLDEPTVGVDVQSKIAILRLLNEINKNGTTIIYTSHHLSEAQEFCNTIALMDHGKIVAQGELKNLLQEHNTDSLKTLFIDLTGEDLRDSNV